MNTNAPLAVASRVDPRITRSESAIRAALISLVESGRGFGTLTVSEVATAAGVTRKTFYARYGSLEQLVVAMVREVLVEIAAGIDDASLRMPFAQDSTVTTRILVAYAQHRRELGLLVSSCPPGLFLEPLRDVSQALLDRVTTLNGLASPDPVEREYVVMALSSAFHGVVALWTQRGFTEPAERIAAVVDVLLMEGLQRLLRSLPR